MKPFPPILLLGLALHAVSPADEAISTVRFSNKDQLSGSLESLSSDQLVWKSPVLEKPTPFFLKNVIDLSLPASVPEVTADHEAILSLTNGDSVRGQLASVTDETVSLDTWFAGRMNFNRLMVSGVKIEGKSALFYRGPSGLEGWTQSGEKPVWTFGRAAFTSRGVGGIARDDLLPEECSVAFDMSKRSDSFSLKVVLFSTDVTSDSPASGYELSLQRGSVSLRAGGRTQGYLGSIHSQSLAENDRVRIEIRASSKSGKVCLFVNGRIAEVWSDPEVAKGRFGKALHFVSGNTLPLRISGIEVGPWDGVTPNPEPRVGMIRQFGLQGFQEEVKPQPREEPAEEGRMELANGDSLEGEVTSIQDGAIAVKTGLGEIKIPVARLRSLALKKVDLEKAKLRNGDIRAWFPDGSSLVFRLDEVGEGTLTGYTQNFGSATFKLSAFNRIEFNIHDPGFENQRALDDW
jgi:hypothetical protein